MAKYVSPCNGYVFKKLFGTEDHEDLTISFLNAILGRTESNAIRSISFKETENIPSSVDGRRSFLDVYCIDAQGKHFIIEMQNKYQDSFFERIIYYMAFVFSRQKPSPFRYENLVPVIFVGVLNHIYDKTHDDVISKYAITNLKHHTVASEHTVYYLVELPKFKKTEDQLQSIVDKWLFFMQQADKFQEIPQSMAHDEKFIEAFATLESMGWSDNDWLSYYAFEDAQGREGRIEKGALERGIAQGKEEGIEQGMQKGIQQEKQSSAIKFLRMGLSVEKVADGTGLSVDQVQALLEQEKNK